MHHRTVEVRTASHTYHVVIAAHLLDDLATHALSPLHPLPRRALLIIDRGLPEATIERACASLHSTGLDVARVTIDALETAKTLLTTQTLLATAAMHKLDRHDLVIAIGGGIVGDVAGFVAATYRRGINIVQCPTTLLAMVDASVGGKTGVNLELSDGALIKNVVGSFHQPAAVLASIDTLSTLSPRQFRSGLAECIKHAMIAAEWGDPDLLLWLTNTMPRILSHDHPTLVELVERNVRIKARVVESDERELLDTGGRALLNLGHTFGHAIETLGHLSPTSNPADAPLLHGEAVALGLIAACATARTLGMIDQSYADSVTHLISLAGLPTSVSHLPPADQILARMGHDKKVLGGRLRLILPTAPGRATVVSDPPREAVEQGIHTLSTN